ncbi:MAG: hypothetical protein Q9170_004703 [Blastenia crenularia]
MRIFLPLILIFGASTAQAELVCLGWGLISPIFGLVCHFKPNVFHAAENNTLAAVNETIHKAEALLQFDLSIHPAYVAYNFYSHTSQGGLAEGVDGLTNTTSQVGKVTIGFAKESANQLVQLYDLTHWRDVSYCLIRGAGHLATQAVQTARKRAGVPSEGDAVRMAQSSVSEKLKRLAKPAVFKITDPNQEVGATISDIAPLLVPVEGIAETAGSNFAGGAVDLAVAGSEDSSRVMKLVGDDLTKPQHFTNEAEAQAVAENMGDETWVEDNCRICGPPPPENVITSRRRKRRGTSPLNRRGNVLTSCCRIPDVISDKTDALLENTQDQGESTNVSPEQDTIDQTDQVDDPIYDPENYNSITEESLKEAPPYKLRDVNIPADVENLQRDLNSLSTGLVPWSAKLQSLKSGIKSSEDLFTMLHGVFTGPSTDVLYKALQVTERNGKLRMQTFSDWWIYSSEPRLKPLQDFVDAAVEQGVNTVAKLKGMDQEQIANMRGNIEFFYTAPSQEALTGVDPRGFHVDQGMMQFAASDTPGLIIRNFATETASRVPVAKDTFQVMKAVGWDMEAFIKGEPNGPTWHSVFGPEMATNGRVSMVMDIFPKNGYQFRR